MPWGGRIFEHSAMTAWHGEKKQVETAYGSISYRQLIFAGGAWLNYKKRLVDKLYQTVMPVGSYIITTEPLSDNEMPIKVSEAFCDSNFIVDYYRRTKDNRVLYGGRCSYSTWEPDNLIPWMRKRVEATFPSLKGCAIDHGWGGLIDITDNRMPEYGKLDKDTYYVQGFSGAWGLVIRCFRAIIGAGGKGGKRTI